MYNLNLKQKTFSSPSGLELLIRGIFCVLCLTGLHLFEVELPEQIVSVIPGNQEFGILEETGVNLYDLKILIVRFYHGCAQKSAL